MDPRTIRTIIDIGLAIATAVLVWWVVSEVMI